MDMSQGDDRIRTGELKEYLENRVGAPIQIRELCQLRGEAKKTAHCARELLLVTGYRPGHLYAGDLARIRDEGSVQPLDVQRAAILAAYPAEIHTVQHDDPTLWRRLRDLVGHGEGIMGLTDSYPTDLPYVTEAELRWIEEAAN
jgi:hypothetical protein